MKNKRIFEIGTLLITIAAMMIAASTITTASDWPMFRNNAGNTGSTAETINLPLTEQWHSSAPHVEENGVVVSNGIAYMSTEDGYLYAFNVATGAIVPGYPITTSGSYSTPAVDQGNDRVYVLAGSTLFAFHLNGTSAWTKNIGSTGNNYNQGPIVDNGYIYIKVGSRDIHKYNSTGDLQWSSSVGGTSTQPSVMGDYVYANSEGGLIKKYNKTTGAEITIGGFPISTSSDQSALTTVDGKIFFKAEALLVYDANNGNLLWTQPCGGDSTYSDSPAVANGAVYIYGWDGKIYAFDENTGATITGFPSVDLNPGKDRNWNSPAVAGDKIFVGAGESQKLKVLGAAGSANAGQVLEEHLTFSIDTQGFDLCSPVISDGVVFAMLDGGGLYAFFGSGVNWEGGAIVINNGENCTGSRDVTLTLDNGSIPNVVSMRISEDPFFGGASWEPFATVKAWQLSSGLGIKTVYAQFKNANEQLSNVFNDKINYSESCGAVVDNTPPITIKTIGTPQYGNGVWVNLSTPITLTATDPDENASGVKEIHYKINGVETIVQADHVTFRFMEECSHTLEFWAVDNAGNIGNHTTQTHYVDDTGPDQTIQFGEPKNVTFAFHNNMWYTGIGPNTPVWINSTDIGCNGGVGSKSLSYNLYIGQQYGDWTLHGSHTIYDNQAGDMNPAVGNISVLLYMDESCWHQIHYWCVDLLGNRAPEPQGSYLNYDFLVDATPPTTQVTYSDPYKFINGDDYISCATAITIYGNDTGCRPNGSGVMKLDWSVDKKINDSVWQEVQTGTVYDNDANDSNPVIGKIQFIIYITESCEHHIYTQATDYFGNIQAQDKKYVRVDCTPPITTKEIGTPQYYNASEDITYVTTRTPIWLNTTDQPGVCAVGCDYLHWEIYIYNGTSQGWDLLSWKNESSNKAMIYFGEECYHKLVWWAVDKFGNKEDAHVQYHKVDNTPPTTIKEYGTPQCFQQQYAKLGDGVTELCITSHTPIYLNATDGGLCPVGSYIIHYRVWYNGSWSNWMQGAQTTDVVITMNNLGAPFNQDCWHFINYYAVDDLNNTEETHNQTFFVDNTPPVIVKTVGDPNCTIDEDEYCILPTTNITIDAFNNGCCVDTGLTLRYKINDEGWIYPTFLPVIITIPEACTHILTIEAWDCLGNKATDVETFHVDIEAPIMTKTVGDPHCDQGNGAYCVTRQTPITVEATDQGCAIPCGPVTIQYNIGYAGKWTGWKNYTGAIYFSEPCEHTLMLRAFDCLGNGMDDRYWDNETFYVDNSTPVIEKTVGKPQCDLGNGTYCITTQTDITINAYDEGCCDNLTVKYRINQGNWMDITSQLPFTFNFTEECEHVLDIWAYDCVGHEIMDAETFYVDDTPPIINKTVGKPNCNCGDNESQYCVTTSTPITIEALNDGCCLCINNTIEYRIWFNGRWSDWIPYNGSFTFQEECIHQLEIRAMDCLGNTATDLETFYVDDTPPVLTKTVGNPHFYFGVDDAGHKVWYVYPLTEISFTAEDFGCCPCNVTTIYYRYWYLGVWTDWMVYKEPITFHKGCVHYLEAYAIDCLGNHGMTDNETFWVCTSGYAGPTVTFIDPMLGSTHCERTLDVKVQATDDITPSSELTVKIWMPGGRRNAPTFWYDAVYNETDGYFHALIDIYEYQNGAELTLNAWAVDEDGYANYALPTTFMVCSNVGYDQWHQKGWNSLTIPWGEISCSFEVTDVLGSIDGNYAWVWYYDAVHDQWSSWYKYRDPGFNTLTFMEPGKQYWVYMETADRYFTDIYPPMVSITYPENGAVFNTTITAITGTAFDNESGINYVTITLYSNSTGKYWDGDSWETTATDLLCNGTETWSYDTTQVTFAGGLYIVTATATDKVGCTAENIHTFTIIIQNCIATKMYTTDADFNQGTLTGLEHETVHDQLQMIPGEISTFPVMWIANAGEDSLSKWDTHQNIELARYNTWFGPLAYHDAWSGAAPSRTCVDAEGNCYVANRHFDGRPADVIKVYATDWIDRNNNGILDTSFDANNNGAISASEMLPMTDTNGNNKIDPNEIVDERIAWAVSVGANNGLGRSLAIDLEGNIWLGLYNTYQFYKLSSVDGSILGGPYYVGSSPYGALVDRYGYLWGSTLGGTLLKLNTSNPADYHNYNVPGTYGLALGYDSLGNTLVYPGYNSPYVIFNSSTGTYSQPPNHPFSCLGIATDSKGNIVAGSSSNGGVAKFAPDGTILWYVAGQVVSEVRGIAVDSEDNVWAIHRDNSKLCKYNGTDGAYLGVYNSGYQPYTYSDATGLGYATSVSVGTWDVIHDSQAADTEWDMISWTSLEPNGSQITVKVRSSNDQMSWSPWEIASNGGMLSTTLPGRYLNVLVTCEKAMEGESPILYDLTIDGTCASCTDSNPPVVNILDPQDGEIRTSGPGDVNIQAIDNESSVTDVYVKIHDATSNLYFNGTGWQASEAWLLCTYDTANEWFYSTEGIWPEESNHTFHIMVEAYDECGNIGTDMHTFTIVSQNCVSTKTYTTDADFNQGTLNGINASNDQLQLISGEVTTYPVMWIANAGEDSISKWDTNTNTELARYHTWFGPLGDHDAWSGPAPSRTCVDTDGNCYVANRHFDGYPADVLKIYSDNWIDRNGNGVMDTCSDTNHNGKIDESEMYTINDTNGNNIIDPNEITDERVAWAVSVGPDGGIGRSLAIDTDGNIWLGLYSAQQYYKLSSVNGSILYGPIDVPITPYGALVDKYGILWGASLSYSILRLDTTHNYSVQSFYHGNLGENYGIALGYDSLGNTHVYLGGSGYTYMEFNSSTSTFSTPAALYYYTNGIATDKYGNICAANTDSGGVSKFAPNGSLIWTALSQYSGEYSTVVDSNNDVWVVHEETSKLSKFNGTTGAWLGVFDTGLHPYTYSDATGLGLRTSVVAGTWTVIFDSQATDTAFNMVSWNSYVPEGTSIVVTVRSSNDLASWSPLETATNGGALSTTPPGRYLQIQTTMKMVSGGTSPILYDLTVDGTCASCTDSNPPVVNILDPLDGEMRTSSPSQLIIEAYDEESSVVDVYVKIHDATTNLFFNETGWQNSEVWLFCTSDINDQWYLDTDWSDELNHTYHITAEAYDECGNIGTDMHTFTIVAEEQQTYSLSGTIYYTGNETGHLIIALFNQNPQDINVTPIDNINKPEYEFPNAYTFTNLSNGTYYVAAHIDMNDNGGPPDSDEPQGWAINKTMWIQAPDPLVIADDDFNGADITLAIPPEENHPPLMPNDQTPGNGATGVSIDYNLAWYSGDSDGDTITYDVYFGTASPPPKVVSNQSANTYDPGTMDYGTKYYWQIIVWDEHGASTHGPIWNFTTGFALNNPPNVPSNPNPANETTGVDINANLGWTGGDPDAGDTVTYSMYFGTSSSPSLMGNQSTLLYDPVLTYATTYYWKIIAWDNHGASTEGPIWSFSTEAASENLMGITLSTDTVQVGDDFTATVYLDPTEAVGGWQIYSLTFDPILAHANSVVSGVEWSAFFDDGNIDNGNGEITNIQSFKTDSYPAINHTLCTINFNALSAGTCTFTLVTVEVDDILFVSMPVITRTATITIVPE